VSGEKGADRAQSASDQTTETKQVVVAVRDLPPGLPLKKAHVTLASMPAAKIPANSMLEADLEVYLSSPTCRKVREGGILRFSVFDCESNDASKTEARDGLTIRVTGAGVSVEGEQVVPLDEWNIASRYKMGGSSGVLIPAVKSVLEGHAEEYKEASDGQPKLRIEVSPLIPYRRFVEVFYTAMEAVSPAEASVQLSLLRPGGERVWREHRFAVLDLPSRANEEQKSSDEIDSLPTTILAISPEGFHVAEGSTIREPVEGCSEGPTVCVNQGERGVEEIVDGARDAREAEDLEGVRSALLELRAQYDFAGLYNVALSLDQKALTKGGLQISADPHTPLFVLSTAMAVLERKAGREDIDSSAELFDAGSLWNPAQERGEPWVERFVASVAK
jgi:hypothetical protein